MGTPLFLDVVMRASKWSLGSKTLASASRLTSSTVSSSCSCGWIVVRLPVCAHGRSIETAEPTIKPTVPSRRILIVDDNTDSASSLDVGLPKVNGYEVCRQLRQQPWAKNVLIVAVTGWGQTEDQQKSNEAGFDAHMVKPPDYAALTRSFSSHLPGRTYPKGIKLSRKAA